MGVILDSHPPLSHSIHGLTTRQISSGSVSFILSLPPQSKPRPRPRLYLYRNFHTVSMAPPLGLCTPLSTPSDCQTDFKDENHPPVTSCTFTALISQDSCLCLNPFPASTLSHVQHHLWESRGLLWLVGFPIPSTQHEVV